MRLASFRTRLCVRPRPPCRLKVMLYTPLTRSSVFHRFFLPIYIRFLMHVCVRTTRAYPAPHLSPPPPPPAGILPLLHTNLSLVSSSYGNQTSLCVVTTHRVLLLQLLSFRLCCTEGSSEKPEPKHHLPGTHHRLYTRHGSGGGGGGIAQHNADTTRLRDGLSSTDTRRERASERRRKREQQRQRACPYNAPAPTITDPARERRHRRYNPPAREPVCVEELARVQYGLLVMGLFLLFNGRRWEWLLDAFGF